MVDEVQSRIGKVRKDTKGQTENTKRTWEKCEVGRKWCSFTQNDCTANVALFHMSLFAFLLFNIGWVTFFTSKLCWKQPWAYGQEHGCCADRLWVWAGWGWDMSLRDVRKRPCLWERVCGQSNWQNRITELVSKLKVIEWVRQTGHTTVGNRFLHSPKAQKTGVCLHLQLVRMYSRVNSHSAALFLSLFICRGCHGDGEGFSQRPIISREPVWMWHVLFSQALFRCWFTCVCCTLPPPPPHLQQGRQTFKGLMHPTPGKTACWNCVE